MAALFSHSSGLEILAVLSRDFSEGKVSHVVSEDCRNVVIPEEPLASALPPEKTCKWVIMCGKGRPNVHRGERPPAKVDSLSLRCLF